MTTVDQVIERVRRRVMFGSRGPVYTLGAAYTTPGTTLTLNETPEHIGVGTILSVDYELFYVQAIDTGTKTATVIPQYLGSTGANHAEDAVVTVDARFPKADLLTHAEEELRSWGNELFRPTTVALSTLTSEKSYDLAGVTGEVYYLLDARAEPEGASQLGWAVSWAGDAWVHVPARLVRGMNASDFASGIAVQFLHYPRRAGTIRVTVAQGIDLSSFTSSTDLESIGVNPRWLDILTLGIRARMVSGDVVSRTDWRASGHARDADEANVLDLIRATQQIQEQHSQRIAHEALQLRAQWPYRRN